MSAAESGTVEDGREEGGGRQEEGRDSLWATPATKQYLRGRRDDRTLPELKEADGTLTWECRDMEEECEVC